ncbi:hypothetical protein [Candidatus Thiosymbion oneisti]|uniref:hypothetical protein n=1 Tax=Candidatus Thiosymbion oneisti TaxID=589554 RepID=UPI000B7F0F15|nr:hypothetical protein [Candidatus Thiosymbion oneisti]
MASTLSDRQTLNAAGCLIVARGLIGEPTASIAAKDGRLDEGHLAMLRLADYPAFYLESRLERSQKSQTAITLTPIYLSYAASSARSRGSGKKYVSVTIAFSKAALKKGDNLAATVTEENTFARAHHDFGRLETGKHYTTETLIGTKSDAQVNNSDAKQIQDFSITVLVTESEKESVALRAIQSAFSSNKDTLKSEFEKVFKQALGIKENK